MGIPRRFDELQPIRIEDVDNFNYADYDLSESDIEDRGDGERKITKEDYLKSRSRRRKEERAERKLRKFMNALDTDGVRVQKNMGARKWRRVENARLLLSFVDKDDICDDFSDIMPHGTSQFAKLFQEKENMKAWKEFIKLDEEEQKRILENADKRVKRKKKDETSEMAGDGWFVVGGRTPTKSSRKNQKNIDLGEEGSDGRKHHPAYSAKACFDRLDDRFKQLFRQRSLPWAFVDKIERELRAFYSSEPDSVWVSTYDNGMDRMLVHAVSQYLMLSSKSVTDSVSLNRITEVRNPRAFFVPPRNELISYLEVLRKERIDFAREDIEGDFDMSSASCSSDPEILSLSTPSEDSEFLVADMTNLKFEEDRLCEKQLSNLMENTINDPTTVVDLPHANIPNGAVIKDS